MYKLINCHNLIRSMTANLLLVSMQFTIHYYLRDYMQIFLNKLYCTKNELLNH